MSPYGADDPATQSVQATQSLRGRGGPQDRPRDRGDRERRRRSQRRGASSASSRSPAAAPQPDVASAVSFYETHDPSMVSRDRPLDLRRRVLQAALGHAPRTPRSGSRIGSPASTTCGSAASRSRTLRPTPRSATTSRAPSCSRSRSSSCCRCCSSARSSPVAAATAARRPGDRRDVLRAADRREASPTCPCSRSTSRRGWGSDSRSTTACSWSRATARRRQGRGSVSRALRRTLETAGRTILFSSVTVAAAVASLAIFPQRFLYSMGIAGAVVALVAATLALAVLPALLPSSVRASTRSRPSDCSGPRTATRARRRAEPGTGCRGS